jgi:hypothetical protein
MLTDFICPICEIKMLRDLSIIVPHTENHIIDVIKKQHPEWTESKGICEKCYKYYRKQLRGES